MIRRIPMTPVLDAPFRFALEHLLLRGCSISQRVQSVAVTRNFNT